MDTLHPSKKRRVNRMGGVGVWRERERERGEWRRGQAVEESGCGLGDEEDGRERWEYDFDGDCLEDEMQSGKSAETYRDDDVSACSGTSTYTDR